MLLNAIRAITLLKAISFFLFVNINYVSFLLVVNVNSLAITVAGYDHVDYASMYTCGVSTVSLTALNTSTVNNLCSTDQLNVNAYDSSTVTLKQSSCTNTINVFTNSSAQVNNICANN